MSGGSDGVNAPPTSTSPSTSTSTSSLPPSLTPFISPTGVGGVRFPIYATIQGVNSPLIYSPTLFGQSVLPWRPLVTTPSSTSNKPITTVTAASAGVALPPSSTTHSSHPPTTSVVTGYATSFAQFPGFMYPVPSLNMPLVMADNTKKAGGDGGSSAGKRRSDGSAEGSEDTKRVRVATATPTPHSSGSSPSPQPAPPVVIRPTPHRSPVIKYNLLPYNIGGAAGQQATPTSLAQAVILSITPHTSTKLTPHSSLLTTAPTTSTPSSSSTTTTPPSLPTLPPSLLPHSLPPKLLITLLRCFGPMQSPPSIPGNQLVTSDLLLDLYRSSYHTTSELSGNLSPESCALLTIAYLSSLRRSERICVDSLHSMLKYARTGESEWLQYYKRHKKMSESTFVQSQLMHLSRISVYPALGRVRVMISSDHLGQGIALTMRNLTQLVAVSTEALPDYVVVLAVRANIGVEFCVLVLEPLQSQLLLQQQRNRSRKLVQGSLKNVRGPLEGGNLSAPTPADIKIEKRTLVALRRLQKRLKGAVQIPFRDPGNDSLTVPQSEAQSMHPTASHVIEHKPRGPFQEQYNVAMHLMQRICGGTGVKLENFRTLDFCVLCPPEENFVREVRKGVVESGLVDLVRGEEREGGGGEVVVDDRVIRCCEEDDEKCSKFLNQVHTNPETLYVVVVEHADIISTLRGGVVNDITPGNSNNHGNSCYGENKILLSQGNVMMLYVTSRPYRLVTNRFLVSAANEIHWPVKPVGVVSGEGGRGAGGEGVEFCCVAGLPGPTVKGAGSGGVVMCEDERMEAEFHTITAQLCPRANFLHIRHQLLLNDYVTALTGHAHSSNHAHPDTQSIIRCLVDEPLASTRGHGPMLLIRSHDDHMGREFFSKLRAARNSAGLQFRFEMILDTGREGLMLSPHFLRRVAKEGINKGCADSGCYSNGGLHGDDCSHGNSNQSHVTYSDLENVPCVIVMTGEERPHISLPSSLRWVDLRLLYPTDITRSSYESELAWSNGHFLSSSSSPPHTLTPSLAPSASGDLPHMMHRTASDKDGSSHHSDNEDVLSESHDPARPHPPTAPLSSSSSRRSSITDLAATATEGDVLGGRGGRERGTGVVEWHAGTAQESPAMDQQLSHDSDEGEEEEEEEVIDVSELPSQQTPPTATMTTTVVIDPPEDQMESHETAQNHWNGMETVPNEPLHTDMDTLFADLSDSDSESEDEGEPLPITRTCLLPRPFYHIWTSRNPQQPLLLPPATGVEWASPSSKHSRSSSHGNTSSSGATANSSSSGSGHVSSNDRTSRPPLFDPDPAHQTSYYRKWSKPSNSVTKKALDMLLRATISGMKRRYLLTGPSQVGKTGVWQLLVRLLHDHLRSSHSVTVENPPLQHSIILQDTPTSGGTHSRVVAPSYLKQLYQELLDDEDKKPFILPPSPPHQTTPTSTASTVLTLSPYAIHDSTHSCATCTENTKSNTSTILAQTLPTSHDSHMTIRWYVPASMNKYCVIDRESGVLERLCLPALPDKPDSNLLDEVPIFTLSLGRATSALLNHTHSGVTGLHVIVTVISELKSYMGAWPGHVIMALPDSEASGKGLMYCRVKQFLHHNYSRNCMASSNTASSPLPWVLVMSDGCVMWRRGEWGDQRRSHDLSLSQVLQTLSQDVNTSECAAISVPQWSTSLPHSTHSHPHSSQLTQYDINHDFLLLNIAMTTDLHYRTHSYTSYDVDFNLQLFVGGVKSIVSTDISVVKKHFSPSNALTLHSNVTTVATEVDNIAVSLHDSVASLVDYPGPYLLEHYLRHKSHVLFPSARSPIHPVLMVDHYINLGSHTHVSFVQSTSLTGTETHRDTSSGKYGGLVLYLCEGRVTRQQLHQLSFVAGACVCLVTHSSGSLVGEVGRLDLEERWKFRLRDEYKTACPDNSCFKPLFFLIGHFGR